METKHLIGYFKRFLWLSTKFLCFYESRKFTQAVKKGDFQVQVYWSLWSIIQDTPPPPPKKKQLQKSLTSICLCWWSYLSPSYHTFLITEAKRRRTVVLSSKVSRSLQLMKKAEARREDASKSPRFLFRIAWWPWDGVKHDGIMQRILKCAMQASSLCRSSCFWSLAEMWAAVHYSFKVSTCIALTMNNGDGWFDKGKHL